MEFSFVFSALFFVVLGLGIALRSIPSLILKLDSPDEYAHFLISRKIYQQKKLPHSLDQFLIRGTFSYPPLLHFILIPFIVRNRFSSSKIISLFADIGIGVLIYYVTYNLINENVALLAFLFYVITPINVIESTYVNPRTLGAFFFFLFVMTIFLTQTYDTSILALSVISVIFILLTHRMATQSLLFISVILLITYFFIDYELSMYISVSLVLGFFLTLIFSKGFYKKILHGHKVILAFHFKQGDYSGRKNFGNPIHVIIRIPWIILFPFLLFFVEITFSNSFIFFNAIIAITFVSLAFLWRYGDNYRYLVYASPPLSIVFSYFVFSLSEPWNVIFVGIAIFSSIFRIGIFYFKSRSKKLVSKQLLDTFEFLKNKNDIDSIATTPTSYVYPAAFFTNKKILATDGSPEPWEKGKDYSNFYLKEEGFLEVINGFKINTFLIDTNKSEASAFMKTLKNSKKLVFKRIFNLKNYEVYDISKKTVS